MSNLFTMKCVWLHSQAIDISLVDLGDQVWDSGFVARD